MSKDCKTLTLMAFPIAHNGYAEWRQTTRGALLAAHPDPVKAFEYLQVLELPGDDDAVYEVQATDKVTKMLDIQLYSALTQCVLKAKSDSISRTIKVDALASVLLDEKQVHLGSGRRAMHEVDKYVRSTARNVKHSAIEAFHDLTIKDGDVRALLQNIERLAAEAGYDDDTMAYKAKSALKGHDGAAELIRTWSCCHDRSKKKLWELLSEANAEQNDLFAVPKESYEKIVPAYEAKKPKFKSQFSGTCNWCGMKGHKETDCRKKASGVPKTGQMPKWNVKFEGTCNWCSMKGHKEVDCRKKTAGQPKVGPKNTDKLNVARALLDLMSGKESAADKVAICKQECECDSAEFGGQRDVHDGRHHDLVREHLFGTEDSALACVPTAKASSELDELLAIIEWIGDTGASKSVRGVRPQNEKAAKFDVETATGTIKATREEHVFPMRGKKIGYSIEGSPNLLSIGEYVEEGWRFIWDGGLCILVNKTDGRQIVFNVKNKVPTLLTDDNGNFISAYERQERIVVALNQVLESCTAEEMCELVESVGVDISKLWTAAERVCICKHPSSSNEQNVAIEKLFNTVEKDIENHRATHTGYVPDCDICDEAAMNRAGHPDVGGEQVRIEDLQFGDMIDVDCVGPIEPGIGGFKTIQTHRDVATGWAAGRFVKDLCAKAAADMYEDVTKEEGVQWKRVGTDNGPEFSTEFKDKVTELGGRHEPSVPDEPQTNPRIERWHGSHHRGVRCGLLQAGAPKSWWPWASKTWIKNYNRGTRFRGRTPFERRYKRKSKRTLLPFGCKIYYRTGQDKHTHKFEPRAKIGAFVGYGKGGAIQLVDMARIKAHKRVMLVTTSSYRARTDVFPLKALKLDSDLRFGDEGEFLVDERCQSCQKFIVDEFEPTTCKRCNGKHRAHDDTKGCKEQWCRCVRIEGAVESGGDDAVESGGDDGDEDQGEDGDSNDSEVEIEEHDISSIGSEREANELDLEDIFGEAVDWTGGIGGSSLYEHTHEVDENVFGSGEHPDLPQDLHQLAAMPTGINAIALPKVAVMLDENDFVVVTRKLSPSSQEPGVAEAIQDERDKHIKYKVWDQEPVEWRDVKCTEPETTVVQVGLILNKVGVELPVEEQKVKCRGVGFGCNQRDARGQMVQLAEAGLVEKPMECDELRLLIAAALSQVVQGRKNFTAFMGVFVDDIAMVRWCPRRHRLVIEVADVQSAYFTAPLRGPPVFARLPKAWRNASELHMYDPVHRVRKAMYGLQRAGFDFGHHRDQQFLAGGWERIDGTRALWKREMLKSEGGNAWAVFSNVEFKKPPAEAAYLLGVRIECSYDQEACAYTVKLDQEQYIEHVLDDYCKLTHTIKLRPVDTPAVAEDYCGEPGTLLEHSLHFTGELQFLRMTRVDTLQAIGQISRHAGNKEWCRTDDRALKRVMQYLQGTKGAKLEMHVKVGDKLRLRIQCDADLGSCRTSKRSTNGVTAMVVGELGTRALIAAGSRQQTKLRPRTLQYPDEYDEATIARATCESELNAIQDGIQRVALPLQLKASSLIGEEIEVEMETDAQAALHAIKAGFSHRLQHLKKWVGIDLAWMHQIFYRGDVEGRTPIVLGKVDTEVNSSDIGTKPLSGGRLRMLAEMCGMRYP